MPEKFIIEGGKTLKGEIEVFGSKNAAAGLIAACLLTKEECKIGNLPLVKDILNMLDILKDMGCEVEWTGEREVKIKAGDSVSPEKIDYEKFSKARTSVLLIGPLLARFKEFKVSRPGGDRIGLRPITAHLEGLKKLGAEIEEQGNFYCFSRNELKGAEIVLPEFSVTATEVLLLGAVLAKGKTIIKVAATEPHVYDLVLALRAMGCDIKGEGAHTLEITGVKSAKGFTRNVIPDYIEGGTFIIMGLATNSHIKVKNIVSWHLDIFFEKLKEMGAVLKIGQNEVEVLPSPILKAVRAQALPFPGFPTDLLPLIVPLLTQAQGKSLIHDPLYENRLNYVQELRKMGADIEIVDPHRAFVLGKTPLKGVNIESWDIRAGASLVVAGLLAQGQTAVSNIEQIDRGYEKIEERLQKLGAEIRRISN